MYKTTSRSLQRRARRTIVAPVAQAAFCADDDLIASGANLTIEECKEERRQLVIELTQIQSELIAAKNGGDKREVERLGLRQQSIQKRLTLIKNRMHELQDRDPDNGRAFRAAVIEIVPQDILDRVFVREREKRAAQGIEARQGGDGTAPSQDESPVA